MWDSIGWWKRGTEETQKGNTTRIEKEVYLSKGPTRVSEIGFLLAICSIYKDLAPGQEA
jgi:hypothetical protein